jgi:hypothetical protein
LQEVTPSLHGFARDQVATNTKKMHWWHVPKLFFIYSELKIVNSPRQMAKQHTTTLRSKTYSVGMLVDVIWDENWDAEYFVNNSTKMSFGN